MPYTQAAERSFYNIRSPLNYYLIYSLEGFSVYSLLRWASCLKSVTHPQFLSSGAFVTKREEEWVHKAIAKHAGIVWLDIKTMTVAETRRFDFENGRSIKPNNPYILCGRISDTGLYSFCYRRILYMCFSDIISLS